MRNYLIVVEGAHDIAVVEKILRLNGIDSRVRNEDELPEVWKHTIPRSFPFHDGHLDRITPIPSFLKNSEVSVAIKNANSDKEIVPVLQQIMDTMLIGEKAQVTGIMLLCDADRKKAGDKLHEILQLYTEKEDFKISINDTGIVLDVQVKKIPVSAFVFPDNEGEGNLENLLLEAAGAVYPELLELAEGYIAQASEIQAKLKKEQYAKKAKVGCIANTMKPGKANQVSIADDEWISQKTLAVCRMLMMLNQALTEFINC